jgi:hypothetical protein
VSLFLGEEFVQLNRTNGYLRLSYCGEYPLPREIVIVSFEFTLSRL